MLVMHESVGPLRATTRLAERLTPMAHSQRGFTTLHSRLGVVNGRRSRSSAGLDPDLDQAATVGSARSCNLGCLCSASDSQTLQDAVHVILDR
jgi:hypothetical protein